MSSTHSPNFPPSPRKTKKAVAAALYESRDHYDDTAATTQATPDSHLRILTGSMVTERAPPKAPLNHNDGNPRREKSPDSDDDDDFISRMASLSKPSDQPSYQPSHSASHRPLGPSGHPQLGMKMTSSRKQKANIFNTQHSRAELHQGVVNKIRGPPPPSYKDRKAPPLPVFNSDMSSLPPPRPAIKGFGGEEFYTDPNKASEDLKNLLEGNLEDEEEEEAEKEKQKTEQSQNGERPQDADEHNAKDSKSGVVEGLKVKLLPHQVEGVEWMRGRELGPVKRGKVPKGGILADDMGLGKTLQTISLILTNQKPNKEDKGWKKGYEGVEKTTLVVAPLALIRQWEHEIHDKLSKTHKLKVCVHHGPNRTKRFKDLALYDVVITTYQILVSEHGHSAATEDGVKAGCFGLHWWRIVLDEAHAIKNRNAKATKASCALRSEYRWCLSGTPMQNNLDELQSLVKFLRIKPYDDLKEWKEHIDLPMKNGKGHIAIRRLHSLLRCFMKRRTKEILKEEGALNPGGKPTEDGKSSTGFKVTERNVVTVSSELSPNERKFYAKLEARADKSIEAMMGGKVNYASALTLLLRMRQACNHPKLVAGKLAKDKDALTTDGGQKSQEVDIDSMADMFAGMGIEASKSCSICGNEMSGADHKLGKEMCADCATDLEAFDNNGNDAGQKSMKKKKKLKGKKGKKSTTQGTTNGRRPRNRKAVIDSDDEDEGSWLVPDGERGSLKLGKAGGVEDENAEGGGDWIGSEDSEDDEGSSRDQSNVNSFVVDDENAKKEDGFVSAEEDADSDSDESLPSIAAITKKMASQTLEEKPKPGRSADDSSDEAGSDSESDADSGSESESTVSSNDNDWDSKRQASKTKVLASAKIRELIKILGKEVEEHKFIVFSQFTSMLDLIEPFLDQAGFAYTRYDGSMKNDEREESLRRLRSDKQTRILLCSLKCGSLGLNLTAATRVVIVEPFWNPVRN